MEGSTATVIRKRTLTGVAFLLLLPCSFALADIYQYVDENGVLHFTNVNYGKKHAKTKITRAPSPDAATARSAEVKRSQSTPAAALTSAYSHIINAACDKYGVDPSLVHAVVKVESDFNPFALSRKGAMGLMQLMPQTAVEMNVKNSFNPEQNIHGGVKYLRYLLDRYEGNIRLALAAYNSGETAVKRWGTIPPYKETQQYVTKILKLYGGLDTALGPRYTIYIGQSDDGSLLLTDNPSSHSDKRLKRGTSKDL